ncbi:MAG: hypothetical protein NTW29_07095 [Bacteroidetes bacterium]|nr:hypothetical protein [Bacteroidota bacterium]
MSLLSFYMRRHLPFGFLSLLIIQTLLFSCSQKKPDTTISTKEKSRSDSKLLKPASPTPESFQELVLDSTSLSLPDSRYLLKIRKLVDTDSGASAIEVSLFKYANGEWILHNHFPHIELMGDYFGTEFKDYNGDGVKDLQLSIGSGMRGGNEHFYLFFLHLKSHQLTKAKGVELVVNPLYDSISHGITSMILVGSGSIFTHYSIIGSDSLVKKSEAALWVERGKTFQRKTMYSQSGKIVRVEVDSLTDGGERSFSPW